MSNRPKIPPSKWRVFTRGQVYEVMAVYCVISTAGALTFRDEHDNIVRALNFEQWDDVHMVDGPYGTFTAVEPGRE